MADSGSRLLTPGKDHQDPEQAVEDAGQPTPKQCIVSEKQHIPAIYLPRQVYIIWLVLAYAAILCTAWIILAWTSKRPFGRSSYNCYDEAGYCRFRSEEQAFQNKRTLRYIADAQTLLSAVALLTIPLTSAVCAAAAVPWLQRRGQKMSVRQLMTLADKGWTSPYVYSKLVSASGWKRYGSSFIALALLLNALGTMPVLCLFGTNANLRRCCFVASHHAPSFSAKHQSSYERGHDYWCRGCGGSGRMGR